MLQILISFFTLLVLFSHPSHSMTCSEVLSADQSSARNLSSLTPDEFAKAITYGARVPEEQAPLFEKYLQRYWGSPPTRRSEMSLEKVFEVLADHPNLRESEFDELLIHYFKDEDGVANSLRIRDLSLIEAPFKWLLKGRAKDYSEESVQDFIGDQWPFPNAFLESFYKALNPRYLNLTLTNFRGESRGLFEVTLGTAKDESGKLVKVGLLSSVSENVSVNEFPAALEAIREGLLKMGYVLGVRTTKDGSRGSVDENKDVREYLYVEVTEKKSKMLGGFTPQENEYRDLDDPFDRASKGHPSLLLVQSNNIIGARIEVVRRTIGALSKRGVVSRIRGFESGARPWITFN